MKRLTALLLALAMCLTLCGCWESDTPSTQDFWEYEPEPPAAPSSQTAAKATAFTLPYLNSQTLDPIACSDGVQQTVGSLLYEGLFALDERFTAQPVLCASYSRSSNALTYTFRLRDGVTFSNGAALTANDVLAAYRRAQASERYAARFANIASMRVNRGAFILTLIQPDSALPSLLDIPIVKSGTEKDTVPLGTGPYVFASDDGGPYLARREHWWRDGAALPERIELSAAKDADTAVYLFSAENAHLLVADLLGETSASALGGVERTDAPTTTLLFLGFNTKRSALAKPELRRAMNAAFDRGAIVTTLLAGHAKAAQFPIPPASPLYPAVFETAYESGAYERALTPEAAEGETPPPPAPLELTLLVNAENSFKVSLAEYLARQLTAAHVTVTANVLPWQEYVAALESGGFDLWLGEVRLTADWNAAPLVGTGGALNYGRFSDAALDTALKAFLTDENEASAAALCQKLAELCPILPIVFKSVSVLTPEGMVEGLSPTAAQPLRGLEEWTVHIPSQ